MAGREGWQEGRKAKYDMETFDEVLVENSKRFMDQAKKDGKPFFIWHNTTRMHVFTYLAPKYLDKMSATSNYGLEEAGMAQMDDAIGDLLKHLRDIGEADNTIVIFTTDNGAEVFTWPDGGMTPFRATKGTVFEGGFRVPAIIRWPGKIKAGAVENGLISGLDWLPTLADAAGSPNITDQLLKGVKLGDRTYKNHLDGYDQMDLLLGRGPSKRHELFYFGGRTLGALRVDDFKFQFYQQPYGWTGRRSRAICPQSSISAGTRSSGRRRSEVNPRPNQPGVTATPSLPGNSGALSRCSKEWRSWRRPRSSIRQCRRRPASTSKPSKPKFKRCCTATRGSSGSGCGRVPRNEAPDRRKIAAA